ncbi:hypothetical protein RESH_00747 [Rhodopirellula europaea SH398]|uniref:Uncharacterized protein n=1 Tax=Rhodopirellula europaea SH398 TaxID=1263868 RepID=M5SLQ8_9BACT|nr:hypothetical protein RESH_00747 [Rhodopirellula europaea SH398]
MNSLAITMFGGCHYIHAVAALPRCSVLDVLLPFLIASNATLNL